MRITGRVKFIGTYDIELKMSVEDFEALNYRQQDELIASKIDFGSVDIDEVEVDDCADIIE